MSVILLDGLVYNHRLGDLGIAGTFLMARQLATLHSGNADFTVPVPVPVPVPQHRETTESALSRFSWFGRIVTRWHPIKPHDSKFFPLLKMLSAPISWRVQSEQLLQRLVNPTRFWTENVESTVESFKTHVTGIQHDPLTCLISSHCRFSHKGQITAWQVARPHVWVCLYHRDFVRNEATVWQVPR